MFKFIHAADCHIDSPLLGLEAYEGAPVERIRGATREAFANLVTLAMEEAVNFVVIAGDLFDGEWQDMRTGLWTAGQFRRLARENIPVYLLRGNHDAASKVRSAISWPENAFEFSVRQPESFDVAGLSVTLHGQGFPNRDVPEDIAANYPPAKPNRFNIGVLHTSLTGSADHDVYAPTTRDKLISKGYDYWALGHIHQRSNCTLRRDEPFVAYCGNTQGRHIKESGAKGCLLVSVDDNEIIDVEFRATDVLRWSEVRVALEKDHRLDDLYAAVHRQLAEARECADGRFLACRLIIAGACAAHHKLVSKSDREETIAEIRNFANDFDEDIWIEKIAFQTAPPIDLDALRAAPDLMGDLLRSIDRLRHDVNESFEGETLDRLGKEFSVLADKAPLELRDAGIDFSHPEEVRSNLDSWLRQAEGMLAAMLLEEEA